ncbi:small hydrophobic protein [Almendravirus cootbay]|uniref:small hydrophobic protein n=1 Tax=Almendravirus cootbay TaxID=1972685 RepID=UPI001E281B4A|nr:small hydrophobic protein [Almendravirus cootbay]
MEIIDILILIVLSVLSITLIFYILKTNSLRDILCESIKKLDIIVKNVNVKKDDYFSKLI